MKIQNKHVKLCCLTLHAFYSLIFCSTTNTPSIIQLHFQHTKDKQYLPVYRYSHHQVQLPLFAEATFFSVFPVSLALLRGRICHRGLSHIPYSMPLSHTNTVRVFDVVHADHNGLRCPECFRRTGGNGASGFVKNKEKPILWIYRRFSVFGANVFRAYNKDFIILFFSQL